MFDKLPSLSMLITFIQLLQWSTANCPYMNTSLSDNNPTLESNWHWLLLIIIAKYYTKENCLWVNLNDILLSYGVIRIMCMNIRAPILFLKMIYVSIICVTRLITCICVPLHNPRNWSRLCKNIGEPTFIFSSWFSMLGNLKKFRTPVRYNNSVTKLYCSKLHNLSELKYMCKTLGIRSSIYLFIWATSSVVVAKIACW